MTSDKRLFVDGHESSDRRISERYLELVGSCKPSGHKLAIHIGYLADKNPGRSAMCTTLITYRVMLISLKHLDLPVDHTGVVPPAGDYLKMSSTLIR